MGACLHLPFISHWWGTDTHHVRGRIDGIPEERRPSTRKRKQCKTAWNVEQWTDREWKNEDSLVDNGRIIQTAFPQNKIGMMCYNQQQMNKMHSVLHKLFFHNNVAELIKFDIHFLQNSCDIWFSFPNADTILQEQIVPFWCGDIIKCFHHRAGRYIYFTAIPCSSSC